MSADNRSSNPATPTPATSNPAAPGPTTSNPDVTLRWPTVLFDLDGTLCNTVALIVNSFQHAHRTVLGEELTEQAIRPWIGRTLNDTYAAWPEHAAALNDAYMDFNLANLERLQTSYPGIDELLRDLAAAGARLGIVTSKRRTSAHRSLAAAGLDQLVTVACAMEDSDTHKPQPGPLLAGLATLGADAAQTVYVGDAVVDLQAARAAGVAGIGVTWGAGDRADLLAEQPVAVVDQVAELRAQLLG